MRQLWLAIYLPSLLIATGQQAIVIMLPLFAAHVALSHGNAAAAATLASGLMALRGAGSLFANIPAGVLVSRFGDRAVMLIALGLLAGAAMLLGLGALTIDADTRADTALGQVVLVLAFIAIAATLFGAASGAWFLARLAFVAEAAPLAYRGRALAGLGGVQRVGLLLGPIAGGFLVHALGYGMAFVIAGMCIALAFTFVLPFARSRSISITPANSTSPGIQSVLEVLRDYRSVFATAGVSVTALAVLRASRQLLIPLWGALLGLDPRQIGITFMISSALEIAMAYPAGYLMDRYGHKWAALPCFALLCISIALLPWVDDWPSLVAVAVIAGIGNGFGSGIMMTFGSDYAPPARRGEFLGVWRMMGDSGQVAGPALIGVVAASLSLAVATWGAAAIGVAGMAMMAFLVQPPAPRRATEVGRN